MLFRRVLGCVRRSIALQHTLTSPLAVRISQSSSCTPFRPQCTIMAHDSTSSASSVPPAKRISIPSVFGKSSPPCPIKDSVYRFLCHYGRDRNPNLEVEAKLGIQIDKQSNQRYAFLSGAYGGELSLSKDTARFESAVPRELFDYLNVKWNRLIDVTHGRDVRYSRAKQTDVQYVLPGGKVVRLSTDNKSGKETCIQKRKIDSMNVACIGKEFDFRISVNEEIPEHLDDDLKKKSQRRSERIKDRISYKFGVWSLDMTVVRGSVSGSQSTTFEIEMELTDNSVLYTDEGCRATASELVDSIRALLFDCSDARNARSSKRKREE